MNRDLPHPLWILLLLGAVLALLLPAEINGDGVGYLRQIDGRALAPGHLAYLPILRGVAALWPHHTLLDLVLPIRLLGLGCALASLALLHDAARRLHGQQAHALAAMLLFGLSHAFTRSAVELETYAPAMLLAVATLWALVRCSTGPKAGCWPLVAAVLAGLATLMHLTLVLLAIPLAVHLGRRPGRRWRVVWAPGVMAVTVAAGIALALWHQGIPLADAPGWLLGADHGIPHPHGWLAPLVALWGLARSLVAVPYPHQHGLAVVLSLSTLAAAAWIVIALCVVRRPASVDWIALLSWCAPLALFAVVFFPSDTERWLFVLPAAALYLAPALQGRVVVAVLAVMALVNLGLDRLPAALDRGPMQTARAAEALVGNAPPSLLVSPGHGWDELVGLGLATPPARFPLIFHVGADGGLQPAVERMVQAIDQALARGEWVFVARLRDAADPRGFKELAWFGLPGDGFARLLRRYAPRPTTLPGLWRLVRPDAGR